MSRCAKLQVICMIRELLSLIVIRSSTTVKIITLLVSVGVVGAIFCLVPNNGFLYSIGVNLINDALFAILGYLAIGSLISAYRAEDYRAKNYYTEKRVRIAVSEAMAEIMFTFGYVDEVYVRQPESAHMLGPWSRIKFKEFVENKGYLSMLNNINNPKEDNIKKAIQLHAVVTRALRDISAELLKLQPSPNPIYIDGLLSTSNHTPQKHNKFIKFMKSGEVFSTEIVRNREGAITGVEVVRENLTYDQRMGEFSRFIEKKVKVILRLSDLEYEDLVCRPAFF